MNIIQKFEKYIESRPDFTCHEYIICVDKIRNTVNNLLTHIKEKVKVIHNEKSLII